MEHPAEPRPGLTVSVPALTKTESLGTTPIGRFQLGENISGGRMTWPSTRSY
jgi:hypothetical protein